MFLCDGTMHTIFVLLATMIPQLHAPSVRISLVTILILHDSVDPIQSNPIQFRFTLTRQPILRFCLQLWDPSTYLARMRHIKQVQVLAR